MATATYDVAIVGMGILGLAHAYWSARTGRRVIVFDRDARPRGASIRNFGFITVTGQAAGDMWQLARRSREVWAAIAPALTTSIQHHGLCVIAQRAEALAVLENFAAGEMGAQCDLVDGATLHRRYPGLPFEDIETALLSPYELRFEAPEAISSLIAYLQREWDVTFAPGTAVLGIDDNTVQTSTGNVAAGATVICPGADFSSLYKEALSKRGLKKCQLQMMRLADPGFRLPFAVQSDLSLVRYEGYAALPSAQPLLNRIENEQPDHLRHGIHLIVVQNADGSLVVGDSHHYGDAPSPFYRSDVEHLILEEFEKVFRRPPPPVLDRWTGIYPYADNPYFVDAPSARTRLVMVTCGAGMSTAFGLAERTIRDLLGDTA